MATTLALRPKKPELATRTVPSHLQADPDIILMMRVKRDDPGAFAELVERYWGRIYGRFRRQLGDRQEAEDLTQEVFLRLYRSRKRYEPRARFATWLYHISRNVARNALRTGRRRPCLRLEALTRLDDEADIPARLPDRSESPSRPLERAELAVQVRSAVAGLGDRQREALYMHHFADHTYVEIAEMMDMTPKAAKSLLYRARNQLRNDLEPFVGP